MESDDIEMYGIFHIKFVLSAYECYFYTMENVWQTYGFSKYLLLNP